MKRLSLLLALVLCLCSVGCNKATDGTVHTGRSTEPVSENTTESVTGVTDEPNMDWVKNIDGDSIVASCSEAVAEDEAFFYYVSSDGVVKVDKFTGKEALIEENGDEPYLKIQGLYLYEGQLYCCDAYSIKRYDAAEGCFSEIWNVSELPDGVGFNEIFAFSVSDGYIYIKYSGVSNVRVAVDVQETELFLDDYNGYAVLDKYVYYISHAQRDFTIYKLNLETREEEKVRGEGITRLDPEEVTMYDDVAEVGGELYYTTRYPHKLYKYVEGGEDELIAEVEVRDSLVLELGQKHQGLFTYEIIDYMADTKDIYLYTEAGIEYIATVNSKAEYYLTDNYLFYRTDDESSFQFSMKKQSMDNVTKSSS